MIEKIQTRAVREAAIAYHYWYREDPVCICGGEFGQWPNNYQVVNGVEELRVCVWHEWQRKTRIVQQMAIADRLSLPIPVAWSNETLVAEKGPSSVSLKKNPINIYPPDFARGEFRGFAVDVAASIARYLRDRGHIIFYVHHSDVLNLTYAQREQEIMDVLLYAPVLVYWHNRDKRENGRTLSLIYTRQYGAAYITEG